MATNKSQPKATIYERIEVTANSGKKFVFVYSECGLEQISRFQRVFESRVEQIDSDKRLPVMADVNDMGTQYIAHAASCIFVPVKDDGSPADFDANVADSLVYMELKKLKSKDERDKVNAAIKKLGDMEKLTSLLSTVISSFEEKKSMKLTAELLSLYESKAKNMTPEQAEVFQLLVKNGTGILPDEE